MNRDISYSVKLGKCLTIALFSLLLFFLLEKSDDTGRCYVNYRKINKVTTKNVYPLPYFKDALSRLDGSYFFTILDMQTSYWKVKMNPEELPNAAFVTDPAKMVSVQRFIVQISLKQVQRFIGLCIRTLHLRICNLGRR